MSRLLRLLALLALMMFILPVDSIQAQQTEPVVQGVFFYSPTCPHCQDVLQNHWPQIDAEFGDQLEVLFVDASTQGGSQIMQITRQSMNIDSSGVPMLIIGSEVMVGSDEIPARAPELIRAGLAAGGISMPAIPGVESLYDKAMQNGQIKTENPEVADTASLFDTLTDDPANLLAVGILALLVFSLGVLGAIGWQSLTEDRADLLNTVQKRWNRAILVLLAVIGMGMSASLLAGHDGELLIVLLAGAELAVFVVILGFMIRTPRTAPLPEWFLPLIAAAGLGVAAYLAHVEMTSSDAVCGIVGNCNAVQQSEYAKFLGVPIGILGIIGYVIMLALFWWGRTHRMWLERVLIPVVVLGVVFSAYLTFLEPFIIGATCLWCLTSAVTMLMILWMMLSWDDLVPNLVLVPPSKKHHRRV